MKTPLLMCLIVMVSTPVWAQEGYPMDVPVDAPPQVQAEAPLDPAYYAGVPQAPVAPEQAYVEPAPVEESSAMDMLFYDSGDDGSSDNAGSLVNGLNF